METDVVVESKIVEADCVVYAMLWRIVVVEALSWKLVVVEAMLWRPMVF
jgi:hypothetical protein